MVRCKGLGWKFSGCPDESLRDARKIVQPPLAYLAPRQKIQLRVSFEQ